MKLRIFALTLLILCLPLALNAQVGDPRNDFAFGVSGGYTMNKVSFAPALKLAQKGDRMLGVAARYTCEKYFTAICGVQMELNYCSLGWQEVIEDASNNTFTCSMDYVQVPFLLQMGWGRERRGLRFNIEAGPQLGYCLEVKSERGGGVWNPSMRLNGVTYQYDNEPENMFDYGIVAGAGVEFSSAIGHFQLSGRYYYGLGDFYDNSKKGYFQRSANQTIYVKLTYLFDIIKTNNPSIR